MWLIMVATNKQQYLLHEGQTPIKSSLTGLVSRDRYDGHVNDQWPQEINVINNVHSLYEPLSLAMCCVKAAETLSL